MAELKPHERAALIFLSHGPDTPGEIDSDEKLCAVLVFADLKKRGLVISSIDGRGPTFHITPAGRAALADLASERGR